jgi:hypothetical protein
MYICVLGGHVYMCVRGSCTMYICVLGGHVYMCGRRSDFISVSTLFLLAFETVPIVWSCNLEIGDEFHYIVSCQKLVLDRNIYI